MLIETVLLAGRHTPEVLVNALLQLFISFFIPIVLELFETIYNPAWVEISYKELGKLMYK